MNIDDTYLSSLVKGRRVTLCMCVVGRNIIFGGMQRLVVSLVVGTDFKIP
jgi:hypothetical protein